MTAREWFDQPDPTGKTSTGEVGLRFECTCCGNCCTGPTGFVSCSDAEAKLMAAKLGMTVKKFLKQYSHDTVMGRSLTEIKTEHGYDCVFLDRETVPGKAICGVYEARPMQCRTWPYWKENLTSKKTWTETGRTCPGLNQGKLTGPVQIRLTRDRVEV